MHGLFSYLTLRSIIIFGSTAFSLALVMLLLNIITIDELATILNLSPEATNALKLVFSRIQEVTSNILDIIGQLLNKLFGWAGVDIDLSRINVDVHQNPQAPAAPSSPVVPASPAAQPAQQLAPGRVLVNPSAQ